MNKKILILTPGFAKDENDTTSVSYLQDFIIGLQKVVGAGNITIIALHYPPTNKKYCWHNIDVYPFGFGNSRHLKKIIHFITVYRFLLKYIQNERFVIHSFWLTDAAILGQIVAKKRRIKHISTAMGQDVKPGNKYLRFLQPRFTTMVALTQSHATTLQRSAGVIAEKIIPLPLPDVPDSGPEIVRDIDVLFVGSFIPLKQPETFVSVIKQLHEYFPELQAVMIGDGVMFDTIQKQVMNAQLNTVITLRGKFERPEVFHYMRRSKVLLHTSEFEGQCLVYAEALANGMYVISRPVGRIEKTEKHMIAQNEESFFAHCKKLLEKELDYTPFQSLETENIITQYLQLYNS
jgi:glycosyltransferase involved in cell wall biosynthesis